MSGPREILRQYLELCASGLNRLEDHLASNAILEWKGVTVKGRSRIVKFMRHKQQDGLVQRFSNVESVPAFEERETHLSTMCTPPENLIAQSAQDRPSDPAINESHKESTAPDLNLSFETPPRVHPISSDPPPLTAGRQFLPLSSSDEEDDAPPQLTPESPTPANAPPRQNAYSELQYLEAIGIVRSSHESKHRGTRTSHHIPREGTPPPVNPDPSTPTNTGSADPPDKRTKLKLSYRSHLQTAESQFALVIYEDMTPRSSKVRRNLFSEEPDTDGPEPSSPVRVSQPTSSSVSPEALPLPDTPPPVPSSPPPGEITPPQTPLEPPGTPHRQRRFLPAGFRTSPRRSRAIMNFTIAAAAAAGDGSNSSSSSSSSGSNTINNNNTLQTWPRKTHPGGGSPGGGSTAKNRKLAPGSSTTVRKPLRF